MKMRLNRILAVRATLLAMCVGSLVDGAEACSCAPPPPRTPAWRSVAEEANEARAVFEGRALSVANAVVATGREQDEEDYYPTRFFIFEVLRQFRGSLPQKVTIRTGFGGGDCGVAFSIGEAYLVYAYGPDKDNLGTSICTRTKHISSAEADLRLLRGEQPKADDLLTHEQRRANYSLPAATVCGQIRGPDGKPAPQALVIAHRIRADGTHIQESKADTSADGIYRIEYLDPGRYMVSAQAQQPKDVPEGEEPELGEEAVTPVSTGIYGSFTIPAVITVEGGKEICGIDFDLAAPTTFKAAGRIIADADHAPDADVFFSLRSADTELFLYSNARVIRPGGSFEFQGLPEGRYLAEAIVVGKAWVGWMSKPTEFEVKGDRQDIVVRLENKDPREP